jgi:hypothetical protein
VLYYRGSEEGEAVAILSQACDIQSQQTVWIPRKVSTGKQVAVAGIPVVLETAWIANQNSIKYATDVKPTFAKR